MYCKSVESIKKNVRDFITRSGNGNRMLGITIIMNKNEGLTIRIFGNVWRRSRQKNSVTSN